MQVSRAQLCAVALPFSPPWSRGDCTGTQRAALAASTVTYVGQSGIGFCNAKKKFTHNSQTSRLNSTMRTLRCMLAFQCLLQAGTGCGHRNTGFLLPSAGLFSASSDQHLTGELPASVLYAAGHVKGGMLLLSVFPPKNPCFEFWVIVCELRLLIRTFYSCHLLFLASWTARWHYWLKWTK